MVQNGLVSIQSCEFKFYTGNIGESGSRSLSGSVPSLLPAVRLDPSYTKLPRAWHGLPSPSEKEPVVQLALFKKRRLAVVYGSSKGSH